MKLKFTQVCYFWGAMDAFYVVRFVWLNAIQGKIPLYDDCVAFFTLFFPEHGVWALALFSLSLLLILSIVLSTWLLLAKWKNVRFLIYAQTPLRILLVVPSLSILSLLPISNRSITLGFIVLSEALKVASFMLAEKTQKKREAREVTSNSAQRGDRP